MTSSAGPTWPSNLTTASPPANRTIVSPVEVPVVEPEAQPANDPPLTPEPPVKQAPAAPGDDAAIIRFTNPQDKAMSLLTGNLDSLDWRNVPPHIMACILTQIPRKTRGGGLTRLTYGQALVFAMSAYEQNVSPLSTQIFFDAENWRASVTLEGRQVQAQKSGYLTKDVTYEWTKRDWDDLPKGSKRATECKAAGFAQDIGCRCRLTLEKDGKEFKSEYLAWLSEWCMTASTQWLERPEHMLQVRAQEKAREAGGFISGISDLPE